MIKYYYLWLTIIVHRVVLHEDFGINRSLAGTSHLDRVAKVCDLLERKNNLTYQVLDFISDHMNESVKCARCGTVFVVIKYYVSQ